NQDGFGDSHINYAWSMAWFKGKLYVGLNKNSPCGEAAATDRFLPGFYTTNPGPGITCAPTPQDVDFRGELWAYTPGTRQWTRVYQSPEIPLTVCPKEVGGLCNRNQKVALDVGYRGMAVFTETDGSQALYVAGVSSSDFNFLVPPPRILRSTD